MPRGAGHLVHPARGAFGPQRAKLPPRTLGPGPCRTLSRVQPRPGASRMSSPFSVPYSALSQQAAEVKQELMNAFEAVLDRGRYILGPEVAAFEQEFAAYCHSPHALGVSSGTCALHLALRALGVREG